MNKEQLKELVKKYFSLTEMTETQNTSEEKQNFDSATLVDGTKITNKKDSAFEVGDELYVITEADEEVLAPSGEHTTESGITVTVDGEGKITGIARPEGGDEGSLAEHEEEMSAEESSEDTKEEVKLAEHEDESEMDAHPEEEEMDIKEEIIEAIMTEVGPAIEELRKKMAEHETKLADHEEKMKDYMSAPSTKPISESKYAKSRSNFEKPKAAYNQKRYEKALFNLTNNSKN